MTEAQYNWVNQIRLAHGYSPLARRYKDTGPTHQARQIERALKVCSPVRFTKCIYGHLVLIAERRTGQTFHGGVVQMPHALELDV